MGRLGGGWAHDHVCLDPVYWLPSHSLEFVFNKNLEERNVPAWDGASEPREPREDGLGQPSCSTCQASCPTATVSRQMVKIPPPPHTLPVPAWPQPFAASGFAPTSAPESGVPGELLVMPWWGEGRWFQGLRGGGTHRS